MFEVFPFIPTGLGVYLHLTSFIGRFYLALVSSRLDMALNSIWEAIITWSDYSDSSTTWTESTGHAGFGENVSLYIPFLEVVQSQGILAGPQYHLVTDLLNGSGITTRVYTCYQRFCSTFASMLPKNFNYFISK